MRAAVCPCCFLEISKTSRAERKMQAIFKACKQRLQIRKRFLPHSVSQQKCGKQRKKY
jgi:hypothetical protein